jgi:hypothetical protein
MAMGRTSEGGMSVSATRMLARMSGRIVSGRVTAGAREAWEMSQKVGTTGHDLIVVAR